MAFNTLPLMTYGTNTLKHLFFNTHLTHRYKNTRISGTHMIHADKSSKNYLYKQEVIA